MSELDELMSRDPLDLSSADIDAIIAYHRKARARRAAGEKPTKPKGPTVDITSVANKLIGATPVVRITRKI